MWRICWWCISVENETQELFDWRVENIDSGLEMVCVGVSEVSAPPPQSRPLRLGIATTLVTCPPPSPPLTWPWSRVVKTLADDQETVSGECKIVRSSHTALALDNVAAAALIIEVKLRVSEVRWQYRPDNTSHVDLDKLMLILTRELDHLIRKLYNW